MEKTTDIKMVCINGVWIRADKAQGRINSLRKGDELKGLLADDNAKKRQRLKEEEHCSDVEIANIMRTDAHQSMLEMGLGTLKRCSICAPRR